MAGAEGTSGEHIVYCGTLTMSEAEWAALRDHLQGGTNDAVEVEISSELGGSSTT